MTESTVSNLSAIPSNNIHDAPRARYSLYPKVDSLANNSAASTPRSAAITRASNAARAAGAASAGSSSSSSHADGSSTNNIGSTISSEPMSYTYNDISSRSASSIYTVKINPATIPVRTSSTKATENGESHTRSPKKYKSLGYTPEKSRRLPEVDERLWMAQGRQPSYKLASPTVTRDSVEPAHDKQSTPLIGTDLINGYGVSWTPEKENILKGPFVYLESHPGKDIRSQMISAFNEWLQVPASSLAVITRVIAMLHTASLLIDDVEDNSQLRRGIPVAHSIFGTAQTINSANYVYFCALQELLTLNNPEIIRIYTDELLNLHRGQGMDLFWRDTLTCPTEDDYLEMVGNKTGGLFRLAIKLMCAESPSYNYNPNPDLPHTPTDYVPLVNTIGLLFQILDDYRNLSDTMYTQNKGLCEDLTEGKFSFPIIHAIRSDPNNLVLINILKQKTNDEEVKKYAVAYMDRCGSFSYSRRVLRALTKKALGLADEVDAGRGRGESVKGILEKLRVERERHERGSHSV